MAQQSEASIPRAGKRKWGYDPDQVDEFLEHAHALYDEDGVQLTQRDIQNVSFDLTRGGYVIAQVDATLARLERAVVDKQTACEISQHGRVAWKAQTEDLYHDIARHVGRAVGERFSLGKPHVPSYDRKQVDKLADKVVDKCAAELGIDGISKEDIKGYDKITAEAVANSVFTQRKGKRGYDERQVDYFLNSCVQLLSRIESYARISDRIAPGEGDGIAVPGMVAVAPGNLSNSNEPLISKDAEFQSAVSESLHAPRFEPAAAAGAAAAGASFNAVSQAEQGLFAQTAASAGEALATDTAPSIFPPQASNESASTIPPSFAMPQHETPAVPEQPASAVAPLFASDTSETSPQPVESHDEAAKSIFSQHAVDFGQIAAETQPANAPAQPGVTEAPSIFQPQASYVSEDAMFAPPQPAAAEPAAPVTPSAPAASAAPTEPPSSSLASLAHMAEVSQELPKIEEKSFMPKVPNLDAPSPFASTAFPTFKPVNADDAQTSGADGGSDGNGIGDGVKFDFSFPGVEIPDLSFPTFDDEKKEQ